MEKPVQGVIGTEKYSCVIEWRDGKFIADEPVSAGGKGAGPDPYTLLLSSLVSCTLVTLRMYIDHKGWDIPSIIVNANLFKTIEGNNTITIIDRDIYFPVPLETAKKERLSEIAQHCPISKILEGSTKVRTFVYHDEDVEKKIKYNNNDIAVVWKPELCKHSGRCVTQLPEVFNLKTKPWVTMSGATTETIIDQVKKCPTGALSFVYNKEEEKASD